MIRSPSAMMLEQGGEQGVNPVSWTLNLVQGLLIPGLVVYSIHKGITSSSTPGSEAEWSPATWKPTPNESVVGTCLEEYNVLLLTYKLMVFLMIGSIILQSLSCCREAATMIIIPVLLVEVGMSFVHMFIVFKGFYITAIKTNPHDSHQCQDLHDLAFIIYAIYAGIFACTMCCLCSAVGAFCALGAVGREPDATSDGYEQMGDENKITPV